MDYRKLAGERIQAARKAAGFTSRESLAEEIPGLTFSALGNYEQGLRYPPPNILVALARILGEPASYLGALDDDESRTSLDRKYMRLDQRGRDTLHRIAQSESTYGGRDGERGKGKEKETA